MGHDTADAQVGHKLPGVVALIGTEAGLIQSLLQASGWGCRRTIVSNAWCRASLPVRQSGSSGSQPQQVYRCRAQCGQRACAISPVAVGVLIELGVTDPVLALNAPAVAHQLQHGFWGGAEAGQKQMGGLEWLPSRVPLAATSTIQLVPILASLMCSGAALARNLQVMSRPWPTS
jgi:hypothetical protein